MLAERQLNEIYSFVEVCGGFMNGVAIPAGTFVTRSPQLYVLGNIGPFQTPSSFSQLQLGDLIELIPFPGAAAAGLLWTALSNGTPGGAIVSFYNPTGSTITTITGPWTFVIKRLHPAIV